MVALPKMREAILSSETETSDSHQPPRAKTAETGIDPESEVTEAEKLDAGALRRR